MNHSNPVLNPLAKVGKTNSVTSLSVGVQYDLRDVVSEEHLEAGQPQQPHHRHHRRQRYTHTAVEYIPSNGLATRRGRSFHHVSAPDFQRYEAGGRGSQSLDLPTSNHTPRHHHRHHHVHHIHHKSTAQGGTTSRTLQNRAAYEPYYNFGSLGRASAYRGQTINQQSLTHNHGSLSESDPDMGHHWTASLGASNDLHPPPVKTARLSNDLTPIKRASSSRRYGSIRVAECSFIEAGGTSQPSTPTTSEAIQVKPHSYASAYNRNQYFDDPALPPPPSPPTGSGQSTAATNRICNGPLSVGLAHAAAAASAAAYTSSRGSNGQHSHIIPPPQNFCNNGDFAPLTTTRIGSTINLASRMNDFYQSAAHGGHGGHGGHTSGRSDSPPF